MTDNELLLAIADIMDKKLDAKIQPLENEINSLKDEQRRINLIIENEIRSDIKLLAENYLPAAKRYEKTTARIEAMQADIDVMKSVIREHSEKLQKISWLYNQLNISHLIQECKVYWIIKGFTLFYLGGKTMIKKNVTFYQYKILKVIYPNVKVLKANDNTATIVISK